MNHQGYCILSAILVFESVCTDSASDEVPNPNNPDIILISEGEGDPGNHEQPEERVENNSSSTVNILKKSN
uniref:Secreted protein n=1 Tax=Trichogramma kaykai TaxID=54128 RepID=A0ABD2XBV8_9HYME